MERRFAVLILSHGRANNVKTAKTLKKCGYTGDVHIVIDDEDESEGEYRERFGANVHRFCKQDMIDREDTMDNDPKRKVILHARNAAWDVADELGLTHFLVLDDDYTSFEFRHVKSGSPKLFVKKITNLDAVFEAFCDFLDVSGAATVTFAQGGDYIGGQGKLFHSGITRKSMNSFFLRTDRRFSFIGSINEDVNTYVGEGKVGKLFFMVTPVSLVQTQTQGNAGGMTDLYLDCGTYVKSFYSVMCRPDCVKIKAMGSRNMRLHHAVSWDACVPKIVSENV